jgi:hypothetical protein
MNLYFFSLMFFIILTSAFLIPVYGQNVEKPGRTVIIGFGIGHVDSQDKTNLMNAKKLLENSVKWASGIDSPKILLLIDPSVNSLMKSKDPDFIQNSLSNFSVHTQIDTINGITSDKLKNYDLVIWSGESFPLRSPLISNTSRALLEFFESGHGVILISDDATWDSDLKNFDPKLSSQITRSLTSMTTLNSGIPRSVETIVSTFDGSRHPIMNGVLGINVVTDTLSSSVFLYSNDVDESLPGFNSNVLAKTTHGNPAVIVQEYAGRFPIDAKDDYFEINEDSNSNDFFVLYNDISKTGRLEIISYDDRSIEGNLFKTKDHFSFIPNPNFSGSTSFSYVIKDELGNHDVAIVHITVLPQNDAPVAKSMSFITSEDVPLKSRLYAQDIDNDRLQFFIHNGLDETQGNLSLFSDGRILYTPPKNYFGSVNFSYYVTDGKLDSLPQTVVISVAAENDPPEITALNFSTPEDKILTGVLNGTDPDNDVLEYSLVYDTDPTTGQISIMTHGAFSFIPKKGFFGDTHFIFQIDDGKIKKQYTSIITVHPKGTPPEARDSTVILSEDTVADVVLNGYDDHGYDITYKIVSPPKFGLLSGSENLFQYDPSQNFYGNDEIIFEVNNGRFTDLGIVTLQVTPVNDPPSAFDDVISTAENTEIVIPVLFNDVDIDGDEIHINSVDDPVNGDAYVNLGKSISYIPNPGVVNDVEIFHYVISDSGGEKSNGTILVNILQKTNTSGKTYLVGGSFNSDTKFNIDVDSDQKNISGKIEYSDKFGAVHLNADEITFFSIDQTKKSATFGGVSFDDKYFSIFVDDNGDSGRDDYMKIKIRNNVGSLIYEKEGVLSEGNVIVAFDFFAIPSWIKNTAKWWSNDQINDSDFLDGIQFMIKNNIIRVPDVQQSEVTKNNEIPSWIKNTAKWWADEELSDSEFLDALKFLIVNGILNV